MYPASDAVYYPLYTKCCELDLPLCMNTGLPGPPIPGEVQNPIHLDRVCVRFPELRLCMIHGADPWWDTAIRLMIKYRNLRMMTSAWSPKRLPESLLHFMRTRGKDRVSQFGAIPELPLDIPTTVVASRNDPWMEFARARHLANAWGSSLVDLGHAGHINVASGFGPWPRGKVLRDALLPATAVPPVRSAPDRRIAF